jgi:hypothetical protein
MKKHSLLSFLLLFCLFLVLGSAGKLTFTSFKHRPPKITIVSSSGDPLRTLFDGLPYNPQYSLKLMSEKRHRAGCQGASADPLPGTLGRIFSNSATVLAQSNCTPSGCLGSGWCPIENQCNTGGPCSGNYPDTVPDNGCPANQGFQYTGGHCGTDPTCGCSSYVCDNGGPIGP